MNNEMFGTLPDGTMYTKRRNLWKLPLQNAVTYKIRNIMVTYGDEDYPYTPAPEIDETVVLTEGAG